MCFDLNAREALASLNESPTRLYLGARYGLTPQTYISPEKARGFLGMDLGNSFHLPLCDVAHRLSNSAGRAKLTETFAAQYDDLEEVSPEAREEMNLLRPIAVGKVLVTGSYSSDLVASFTQVTTAVNDDGVSNIRPSPDSRNTYLVMLHGWRANPGGVLVAKQEVDGFEQGRQGLTTLLRGLLHEQPWVVLGFDQAADATFFRLCWEVCHQIGLGQRPIYVVDPRESEIVVPEWPRDPLRHVRMCPLEFLQAVKESREEPIPPDEAAAPGEPPDEPSSPSGEAPQEASDGDGKDSGPATGPEGGLPPEAPRHIEIETLDGRVFRTTVPGDLGVSTLAGQFVRRHVHGERSGSDSRRERAVVELERDGRWQRLNANESMHDAGVQEDDRLRVYSDAVAGAVNPQRREAELNDVQMRLEELARRDERVEVRANLPRAADRYEITLRCGGWGPPATLADRPYPTAEQKVRVEYPVGFPEAPPLVWWRSPIFHPNVRPRDGFVCLGALQESFTPLFGPVELVHLLIELSEYRNYELDGVLNREAAIWAQLRAERIVEHGGWPYQPMLSQTSEERGPVLEFEDRGTGVGLQRRRRS